MSRVVLLSITLAVCAGLAHGQSRKTIRDGYDWRKMSGGAKMGFVTGYYRGALELFRQLPEGCKKEAAAVPIWPNPPYTTTVDQIAAAVDHF
jgi:hypothetical protein